MNGYQYILSKQLAWALRQNIKLVGSQITKGTLAYTQSLNENLFKPMSTQTVEAFKKGDGGELMGDASRSAKMCAVHSSSAIGVNVLEYWNQRNVSDLAYALGLCRKGNKHSQEIHFEQKYPISTKFNRDPNIDAVIINSQDQKIKAYGIECKFSEAYSSRRHSGLSERYLNEITALWDDIPHLLAFTKTISPDDDEYHHLHPAQLVKHILGLKNVYKKSGFRLLYLWYDVLGEEGARHRSEIEKFAQVTQLDRIKFHAISYQELITILQREFYKGNEKYLDYITNRYL